MNFIDVVNEFESFEPCTGAFVSLKQNMEKMTEEDPDNAAVFFFLYGISLSHHRFYEDQETSPEFSLKAKTQMLHYLKKLSTAFHTGSKGDAYRILSEISSDYLTGNNVLGV